VIDRQEKTFSSNPLKSISGGPYSPIPKGLIDQMAAMKLRKSSSANTSQAHYQTPQQQVNTKISTASQNNSMTVTQLQHNYKATPSPQWNYNLEGQKCTKRKIGTTINSEEMAGKDLTQDFVMAGLEDKASQQP